MNIPFQYLWHRHGKKFLIWIGDGRTIVGVVLIVSFLVFIRVIVG